MNMRKAYRTTAHRMTRNAGHALMLVAGLGIVAAAMQPAAAQAPRNSPDRTQPSVQSIPMTRGPQAVRLDHLRNVDTLAPGRRGAITEFDTLVDQVLGQLPEPVLPGTALTTGVPGPVWATTEYFCSDADGVSLPANEDSVCPEGYIKVSVTTCEAGEPCEL